MVNIPSHHPILTLSLMSGCMNASMQVLKLSEITKYLRSRNLSLVSLLPLARKILESQSLQGFTIYFPHKEEWLLEWVIHRLHDDNVAATEARCNAEIWRFILRLLPTSTSAGLIFKKHNILQAISKAFREAVLFPASIVESNYNTDPQREVEKFVVPQVVTSSLALVPPGGGLPPQNAALKLRELLESVGAVLLHLQLNTASGGNDGSVVTMLRAMPDTGAQVLGSYLDACYVLMRDGLELEEACTYAILNIWRSSIWGNPNMKQISVLFSNFCLVPATRLISIPSIPFDLRSKVEQLIADFIFCPDVLPDPATKSTESLSKDLKRLLQPLKSRSEVLSNIFRIGLISQDKKRESDRDTVEVILNSVTSGVLGIETLTDNMADSDAEIIIMILEVLLATSTTVSSETIARHFDLISNLASNERVSVRWNSVAVALRLDYEIFLGKGSEDRKLRLLNALTRAGRDEGIALEVVELLIDCFVKARDLEGFVSVWVQELGKVQARGGIWESDRVAGFFADKIEKSLLATHIDKLLRMAWHNQNWIVVDAVLRGVRREDTEYTIRGSLQNIVDIVSKGDAGWRGWRAVVRAIQIDKSLAESIQRFALEEMRKSAAGTSDDQSKQLLFTSEALMYSADIDTQAVVLSMLVQVMNYTQRGWDGSIDDVDHETLPVAMVFGFTDRWLGVIELVSSNIRTRFVDQFLDKAMKDPFGGESRRAISKVLWLEMLARGVYYEYSSLKDAVLAALITKLEVVTGASGDVETSLRNIRKDKSRLKQRDIYQYEFLLTSITMYPVEAIKRAVRERILDLLVVLDARLEVGWAQGCLRQKAKMVVERLWSLGNARSFLARDASEFINWVLSGGDKSGRKIIRFILETKEQERSREFLSNLIEVAEASLLHAGLVGLEGLNACGIIVEEFWQAGEEITTRRLRSAILKKLRDSIESREVSGPLVGVWRRIWILSRNSGKEGEALGLARGVIENVKVILPKLLATTGHPRARGLEEVTKLVAETLMLLCACSKTGKELVNTTALAVCILDSLSVSLKSEIMIAYKKMISVDLDTNAYLECLETVADGCFSSGSGKVVELGCWEVLKILLEGAQKPEDDELSKNVITCLSTVLSNLSQSLPRAKTVNEFIIISDCMTIILREKAWSVMQYNIDETLVSVAITASPSGPSFNLNTTAADEIVIRLCNFCLTILMLQRRRIRGSRSHLIIAALQSLLYCIYKRKKPEDQKKSDKILHPPWLLACPPTCTGKMDDRTVQFARITEKSTSSFNRLLVTLCEPTTSSVRETTNKEIKYRLVNSVRDREKREVASCVGSLLGELLNGKLGEGFEGDISPSINAILNMLGPEGVKSFSKTVDREGRAMLRELWDEYQRVGAGANEKW